MKMLGNEKKPSNEVLNEGSSLISKALFRIVLRYMTKNGKESPRLSNVYEYCLRILGSRLQPTILRDEGHLLTVIQKKCKYSLISVKDSESDLFQRFTFLNSKLSEMVDQSLTQKSIQKSWEVLYFLFAISDQPEPTFNNISIIKVPRPMEQQEKPTSSPRASHSTPIANVFSSYYLPSNTQLDGKVYLSETDIVRELLFVFQGIDGKYVKYVPKMKRFDLDKRVSLPSPAVSLVNKLSVVGELFKDIEERSGVLKKGSQVSIFQQSLLSSIQDEMQDFLRYSLSYGRLVAMLESQIEKKEKSNTFVENGLSLKRLFVWTNSPMVRLRLLNQILELSDGKKGCKILTIIHSLGAHGDSSIKDYVQKLMQKPFFSMLVKWIYEGELDDPFVEFFVISDLNADSDNVWKSRYIFKKDMLPSFFSESLAMKAFLIGKSLNFIRHSCQDSNFSQAHSLRKQLLIYGDLKNLELSIDSSYKSTTSYLMNLLFTKYELVNRFEELKAYLLLGQGDFAQYLMDNLENSLSKSAGTIYRHNLTGTLESAMRFTNPNYESTGLQKRLDIRPSEVHGGEKGWDIFALDYSIEHPLNTIFTPQLMHIYQKLFIFLWKLKRVHHLLSKSWRNQLKATHTEVTQIIHKCNLIRSEMMHFVNQLQNYILFEVIECSWKELMEKIQNGTCDLNGIIDSHINFLQIVLQKGLVSNNVKYSLISGVEHTAGKTA
ncbi:Gamma-tubulin complex component 3 [Boothiomyces sp. JEL0866]|nr:Gamma-tubulin complex component 3 [Boothiomyces sp. JEL0866]KAJ3321983.1 Gamma-tubulin complex component 3 [Boothiomyces sp. JEL0866]